LRESGKEDGSDLPAVERLAVNSPKELTAVLEERVAQNNPFGGPKPKK
jgi:hypothetical protein